MLYPSRITRLLVRLSAVLCVSAVLSACQSPQKETSEPETALRERVLLESGWRFFKYEDAANADPLIYDVRPTFDDDEDGKAADAMPTEAEQVESDQTVLKPWILPTANAFIANPAERHSRPTGSPGSDFPFVQAGFDDSGWQAVTLPHDWAITGPFYAGDHAPVGGGMGRLPSPGVAWYRRTLDISADDFGKALFLEFDGAMSYAMVWVNGQLVGGWPYGYASWRVEITDHVNFGGSNQIAVRLDNPPASSRWYPGGGLYRNVWLSKQPQVRFAQYPAYVTTPKVSSQKAQVDLQLRLENAGTAAARLGTLTQIYELNSDGRQGQAVASITTPLVELAAGAEQLVSGTTVISQPNLWGPHPTQVPNRYLAVSTLLRNGQPVDHYETRFGIRELRFDGSEGLFVNGERIELRGANQHHDLGALGAAFNVRAAERQLQLLQDMGTNAIRMAHNPPDPQLLELCDRMGFLVIDEIFDVWERKKTPLDFHLIFPEWSEPDMRAFIRRDRNHPSVILWSIGNEVGEQYTDEAGAAVAQRLQDIVESEDLTRPTAGSMNYAKPDMPLPAVFTSISLNYQGEGIRDAPAYSHLKGIRTTPLYPKFHQAFPDKVIISSENAAAVSSRGEYLFPVTEGISAPVADGSGGNPQSQQVSSYELYTAPFGSSADKVFRSLDQHPYVGGGFVWSGWDYLGEPTPYYGARSSYFGVIDLAGFKKDRYYLYQANWRPDLPMAHILPHWNWPDRVGKVTPVHVFTSGDEAELFLNGRSLGRKQKGDYEYRLRWDDVVYEPGELRVQAYKNGKPWAEAKVETTGAPAAVKLEADRTRIAADGKDLSFITATVVDAQGRTVANAKPLLTFSVEGPGTIVVTDNGDSTDLTAFPSLKRKAFNGYALAIVRGDVEGDGEVVVRVAGEGLEGGELTVVIEKR